MKINNNLSVLSSYSVLNKDKGYAKEINLKRIATGKKVDTISDGIKNSADMRKMARVNRRESIYDSIKGISAEDVKDTLIAVAKYIEETDIEDVKEFTESLVDYVKNKLIPNIKENKEYFSNQIEDSFEKNKVKLLDRFESTIENWVDKLIDEKETPPEGFDEHNNALTPNLGDTSDYYYDQDQIGYTGGTEGSSGYSFGTPSASFETPSATVGVPSASSDVPNMSEDLGYVTGSSPSVSFNSDSVAVDSGNFENNLNNELIQDTLGILENVPGVGVYASVLSGILYALDGDWENSMLTFASAAIPFDALDESVNLSRMAQQSNVLSMSANAVGMSSSVYSLLA